MTTLREAAQQALEALEATHYDVGSAERQRLETEDAITALRKALAQQEQEPVAWVNAEHLQGLTLGYYGHAEIYTDESQGRVPLYTHPPRREWKGLTKEEIESFEWHLSADRAYEKHTLQEYIVVDGASDFASAIEQALKEKNNG